MLAFQKHQDDCDTHVLGKAEGHSYSFFCKVRTYKQSIIACELLHLETGGGTSWDDGTSASDPTKMLRNLRLYKNRDRPSILV